MARTRSTLHARVPADRAFDFVSDFRHAPLWDPQAIEVQKVTEGAVGPGTRFLMFGSFMGRSLRLPYEIVGYDRPSRVVLEGATSLLRYRDEITFVDEGSRTRIVYDAELTIRPAPRLIDRAFQLVFDRIAIVATRGMAQAIEAHAEG